MKKWKVALIGCGSIADNTYLPRIGEIPEADLVAVCDIIPERAKNYAEKFHVPAWYTSIDELLEKCDFEILMNTTSIPAHHEINMKALRAGKHLYSQKPVGLTVEEVTEQIEAAKAAGVKYTASPIHMLRDDIRFAKKLIADGCIGEIMKVHTNVCHGGPEYFQYRTHLVPPARQRRPVRHGRPRPYHDHGHPWSREGCGLHGQNLRACPHGKNRYL